ncbi:RNA recognition motif domain-containing protein [Portibacter marinus]|uniref:RNA recognition motif domain-containing protein n=1 Tax=Portibacter marinus TaxID=2898660 RepID=UPI001F3BBF28|nr:RNA-binding protein [Portibacter marinus]
MNIFVAKLSYDTSEATLQDTFERYGEVESVKIIMDREQGRSKGFGFVEMPNEDEAYDAINALNDSTLDGREIVVKKSKPKDSGFGGNRRGGGGGGYNRGGGGGYNRGGGNRY